MTLLSIRLKLDGRKSSVRADGTSPIVIHIPLGNHGVDIPTDISVRADEWDKTTGMATGKQAKRINSALSLLLGSVQQTALELRASGRWSELDTPAKVRQALQQGQASNTATDVVSYMKARADGRKRDKTKESILSTAGKIERYTAGADLSLDDVTVGWLRGFEGWLLGEEGLAINTVGIHMRNLRAAINLAIDEELTDVYGFRRYKIPKQATRHRNLTPEEFRALLDAPVTEDEAQHRDIFLLGFLLIGINIVDMAGLTEIDHGRIHYRRAKTGRLYSIKVEPEALEIIERHRGETHLLREFDSYSDHRNYTQHLNKSLQRMGGTEVGKKGKRTFHPLYPDLTYYWCRHTWATAAANIGISRDTIKLCLGHGPTETMDTYVEYDLQLVDDANRKVIDWVLYGKR